MHRYLIVSWYTNVLQHSVLSISKIRVSQDLGPLFTHAMFATGCSVDQDTQYNTQLRRHDRRWHECAGSSRDVRRGIEEIEVGVALGRGGRVLHTGTRS